MYDIIGQTKNPFQLIEAAGRADRENNGRQADALGAIKHHAILGKGLLEQFPLRAKCCSCQPCLPPAQFERQYT